mmetsp:Transcript_22816/g.71640  ORF Transcript_22816/g.71640 Transcript_22816/m.71640 type:complete len:607 (+) Transcript_22816:269-2089(+)
MQQSSSSPSLSSTLALAPADALPDALAAPPTYRRAAASTPAASWTPSPRPPPASKSPAHTMNWFMIGGSGGCALAARWRSRARMPARKRASFALTSDSRRVAGRRCTAGVPPPSPPPKPPPKPPPAKSIRRNVPATPRFSSAAVATAASCCRCSASASCSARIRSISERCASTSRRSLAASCCACRCSSGVSRPCLARSSCTRCSREPDARGSNGSSPPGCCGGGGASGAPLALAIRSARRASWRSASRSRSSCCCSRLSSCLCASRSALRARLSRSRAAFRASSRASISSMRLSICVCVRTESSNASSSEPRATPRCSAAIAVRMRGLVRSPIVSWTVAHSTAGGAAPATSRQNHSQRSMSDSRSNASGKFEPPRLSLGNAVLGPRRTSPARRRRRTAHADARMREGTKAVEVGGEPRSSKPRKLPKRSYPKSVPRRSTAGGGAAGGLASAASGGGVLLLLPPPDSEDGSAGNLHSSSAGRFRPPRKDSSGAAALSGSRSRSSRKDQRSPPPSKRSTKGTSRRVRDKVSWYRLASSIASLDCVRYHSVAQVIAAQRSTSQWSLGEKRAGMARIEGAAEAAGRSYSSVTSAQTSSSPPWAARRRDR